MARKYMGTKHRYKGQSLKMRCLSLYSEALQINRIKSMMEIARSTILKMYRLPGFKLKNIDRKSSVHHQQGNNKGLHFQTRPQTLQTTHFHIIFNHLSASKSPICY